MLSRDFVSLMVSVGFRNFVNFDCEAQNLKTLNPKP